MRSIKSVSVFGLGKLGACIAATFAQRGFEVVGIDIDPEKVRCVNAGQPPVEEPLLSETVQEGHSRLRASLDPKDALFSDVSFFIPPSPSLPDGSFSNEFLLKAMQPMAKAVREANKKGHIFVVSSTTTPGAMRQVIIPMLEKETGWIAGRDFGVCYNPEFIALGNVVRGLLEPDMVLIGESDPESGSLLEELYKKYNTNTPRIARMSITSAELTKISVNSYITMKISFTNQLRLIAEKLPDTNIHKILEAIGSDSRIGQKYLKSGLSYGGPCFPRDNRLVSFVAKQVGLEAPLAEASDKINEAAKFQLFEQVSCLAGEQATIAVLGMTYKPDTYITEEAAGLYLAQKLKRAGHKVLVHDFVASPANSPSLHEFEVLTNIEELSQIPNLAIAAICCPDTAYKNVSLCSNVKVVDPWGILS